MVLLFSLTLFVGSFLLFLVQPMVGKMILPKLGGTPAVWNTCMLFFQAALLAGYAYAHRSMLGLGPRRQPILHLLLLLVAVALLPITLAGESLPPASHNPVYWLLGHLLIGVGLPFFVLSSNAPLLQRWFANTGHPSAHDPYFLYAASNLGSLLGLLGYPLVIEPLLTLHDQGILWSCGYALLIVLTLMSAVVSRRSANRSPAPLGEYVLYQAQNPPDDEPNAPSAKQRLKWVLLAFVPSSLMLGMTTYVTTNVAAVPLLWVIPLALYLLTFVIVFSRKPILRHSWMTVALRFLVIPTTLILCYPVWESWPIIGCHLLVFFVATMVCHGHLVQTRPPSRYLTEFYLWLSVGGVLGGVFNAIVAPMVFKTVVEYQLMIAIACLALPAGAGRRGRRDCLLDAVWPLGLAVVALGLGFGLMQTSIGDTSWGLITMWVPLTLLCFAFRYNPVRYTLGLLVVLFSVSTYVQFSGASQRVHVERNFFGVKKILQEQDRGLRKLVHGDILHGAQSIDPDRSSEPLLYYHRNGPLGDVFAEFQRHENNSRVGIIGLGIGSMAAYFRPKDTSTFYEIDPAVARIAEDPELFSYLARCRGRYDIVLGDGRLTIGAVADEHYHMIILDAFSSDAIPTHLLTREALQLYLSKLDQNGMLAFHVSNRYLHLAPLLANLADEADLACLYRCDLKQAISESDLNSGRSPCCYVVMARGSESLGTLGSLDAWSKPPVKPGVGVWTDQFSNIVYLLKLGD